MIYNNVEADKYYNEALELLTNVSDDELPLVIEKFLCAINLDPNNADYYNDLSYIYKGINDCDNALLNINKSISIQPDNALYYNNRASIYEALNEQEKALADYTTAINKNDKDPDFYFDRSLLFYEMKNLECSLKDIDIAIKLNPNESEFFTHRSFIYSSYYDQISGKDNQKNADKYLHLAIDDLTESIKIETNPRLYLLRGKLYFKLNNNSKLMVNRACNDLNVFVEHCQDEPEGYFYRAEAYWHNLKNKQAIADAKKFLSLTNETNNYMYWLLAHCNFRMGLYNKTIIYIDKILDNDENPISTNYLFRGYSYHMLEQYDKAIADYTKCIDVDPTDFLAIVGRADAYAKINMYENAINDYKLSLTLKTDNIHPYLSLSQIYYNKLPNKNEFNYFINKVKTIDNSISEDIFVSYCNYSRKDMLDLFYNSVDKYQENDLYSAIELCEKSISIGKNIYNVDTSIYSLLENIKHFLDALNIERMENEHPDINDLI